MNAQYAARRYPEYTADVRCARPGCEVLLNARQKYNRNRYCSPKCAAQKRAHVFPLPRVQPDAPPVFAERWIGAPPPPPPRAQIELMTEPGYRYFRYKTRPKGEPNLVMFERGKQQDGVWQATARPFGYCAYSQWTKSSAYHRSQEGERHADSNQLARLSVVGGLRGWSL